MEIVERIALGESKKEVAFHTHRSVYTVETTVKNAYDKLGFSKISDLVIWYIGQKFNLTSEISELISFSHGVPSISSKGANMEHTAISAKPSRSPTK